MELINQQLRIQPSNDNEYACVFTGHRELYDKDLKKKIQKAILLHIEKGVYTFYNGVAKGFDLLSAECVLELKKEFPHLKLIACIPYYGQEKGYSQTDKQRYSDILKKADEQILLSERYYKGCLQNRNRFMVERCQQMIAYLKQDTGGTAYTVKYFKKLHSSEILFI